VSRLEGPERGDRPFAVVDVGSNSARMIVFRLRDGAHLDVIEDARAPLRLARELHDDDELGTEAIERAIEALLDFRSVAQGAGVRRILAIATSAVREASDGDVLVTRARELGIPLEVIDGDVEARLGFVGAVHDLPVVHGATMDVGGGTTEISRFRDRRLERSWTLPLGSLRLADRFFEEDPPTDGELKEARKEVESVLVSAGVPPLAEGDLIGIGGTVRNLAKIDRRRTQYPLPILHGYELREDHVARIVDDLARRPMRSRAKIRGLNPDRADSIVAGGLIVQATMRFLGARRLVVSSRGLREGLALGGPDAEVPDPAWVRTISILTLAARFATWEPKIADRRWSLAGELLDELDPEPPGLVREMLGHAAVVLDVGRAIDYYDRFEHAATILTSSDLAGFTHGSLGLCTAILRQAEDDSSLGPFGRLVPKDARPAVLRAATVLALADELNRRIPSGDAARMSIRRAEGTVEIAVPVAPGWRPRGVERRFRRVFGAELSIAPVPRVASGGSRIQPD
jgi:exopolyphosphatase/guanosine-5'-triphosphate,3'-diphosphate pyrophosphatase